MFRTTTDRALALALLALGAGQTAALTRDIADLQPTRLTFGLSVLNQLSFDTYREPFDELPSRSHNLLFANIGRHSNLSPWQGQQGSYARYVNALIGNNGATNVEGSVDSIQGSLIRRENARIAWGSSFAFLAGNDGSDDSNPTTTFSDVDDLTGLDLRGGAAWQLSERHVLGGGLRVIRAESEVGDQSVEQGVGGFVGSETFEQLEYALDASLRSFINAGSSWEVQLVAGSGSYQQEEFSESLDDEGVPTSRFVVTSYDIDDLTVGIYGGYNRLKRERLGETEYRLGLERSERELGNNDLSYTDSAGVVTPAVTLLSQEPLQTNRILVSAKSIFQAGQTELFAGGSADYTTLEGATETDAAGTITSEALEDTQLRVGAVIGLRQPLLRDTLRLVVSGRADLYDIDRDTTFATGTDADASTQTITQYAIGLEGVLANVTFDLAWLISEEPPATSVDLGLPSGARRVVELDRLLVSAAVSW
jgi:hypothetical protein